MKIAFVSSSGWTSRLIQWFTDSRWSHAMLVLDQTLDGDHLVLEAVMSGVRVNFLSNFQPKELEIYDTITEDWNCNSVKQYIGSKYGKLQIIGFVIAKLFGLKNNPIGQGIICSELVLLYLINSPFSTEFKDLELNKTSPEDLYEIIIKSSSFKKDT